MKLKNKQTNTPPQKKKKKTTKKNMLTVQTGTSGRESRTMPKQPRPIMAEMDCDVVHCPTLRNKHWMFDPQLADIVNQFAHFPR